MLSAFRHVLSLHVNVSPSCFAAAVHLAPDCVQFIWWDVGLAQQTVYYLCLITSIALDCFGSVHCFGSAVVLFVAFVA